MDAARSKEEKLLDKAMDEIMKREEKEKETLDKLLKSYEHPSPPEEGEIVEAKVVEILKEGLLLDLGTKREGFMKWEEVGDIEPKVGDVLRVMVLKKDPSGLVQLSHREVKLRMNWGKIRRAFQNKTPITCKIEKPTRGGFIASIGPARAFVPTSHLSLGKKGDPEKYIGKKLRMKVIQFEEDKENVVLSRKIYLLDEKEKRKERTLANLEEGKIVKGKVTSITRSYVFVDLGGIEGIIYPENLSWGKVDEPHKLVKEGERIEVKVLKLDREKEKISLGIKQLKPDPWSTVEEKYKPGMRVKGRVTHLTSFGAFVELEEGVEGLLHISDLSWTQRISHPQEVVKEGEEIEVMILSVDQEKRRIGLGLKQTKPNPWDELIQKYKVGDIITGKVEEITDFGAFVEVLPGIDGLIHVSEISRDYVSHPQEVLSVGQKVKVEIMEIDRERKRVRLSIRRAKEKEEKNSYLSEAEEVLIGDYIGETLKKLKGSSRKK